MEKLVKLAIRNFQGIHMYRPIISFVFLIVYSILLTSCSWHQTSPEQTIINYYAAILEQDYNQTVNLSCAGWEPQAKNEFDSFAAVKAELKDVSCSKSGVEGVYTLIKCTGKIIANYGNEILEIDLSVPVYKVVEENGDWRMCGYD